MSRWDRRRFLKSLPLGAASLWSASALWRAGSLPEAPWREPREPALDPPPPPEPPPLDAAVDKSREFDRDYPDDVHLEPRRQPLLRAAADRFARLRDTVGFGHFNLLGFDESLAFARRFPAVGAFPRPELDLLDELFHADAARYGFRGEKVLTELTARIDRARARKIAGSGHYLLRGRPLEQFERMRRDLGETLVLTSGVRGMAKQFQLFLAQAVSTRGNLSRASRSLAPPGYSFHAKGDFDVGKAGFGLDNFTETFCETDEYRRLIDLGYVSIRYFESNPFGVRHEPWHIKVA